MYTPHGFWHFSLNQDDFWTQKTPVVDVCKLPAKFATVEDFQNSLRQPTVHSIRPEDEEK